MKERLKSSLYLLEFLAIAIAVAIWGRTALEFLTKYLLYYVVVLITLVILYLTARETLDKQNDESMRRMCFWISLGATLATVFFVTPIGKPAVIFFFQYIVWGMIELVLLFFAYTACKSIITGKSFDSVLEAIEV